ncbi:hypothetical protein C1646_751796 [Rhizophagus diaphanus]|nr:hypothetical protein C1646_751796 [Rhizophagus diaphanus] [Rhizophagus sp. MUCL 43196]
MDQLEMKPTQTVTPTLVEEFTNLSENFSERLPLRPLLSTKPKEDNLSSDDSDETKDSNKKKRKKKKEANLYNNFLFYINN